MSLDGTYSGLLAAVADLIERSDLTTQIVDAFVLCEADLNARLTLRTQWTTTVLTGSATPVALPTDFLEAGKCRHNSSPYENISLVAEDWANDHDVYRYYYDARPKFGLIEGNTLRLATKNAGSWDIDFGYYKQLQLAVTLTSTTNTTYPGLYFYGTLNYISPLIGNDERIPIWQAAYQDSVAKAITQDKDSKWSIGTPTMRVRVNP